MFSAIEILQQLTLPPTIIGLRQGGLRSKTMHPKQVEQPPLQDHTQLAAGEPRKNPITGI